MEPMLRDTADDNSRTKIFLCHSGAQKDFSHQLWVDLKAQHRDVCLDIVSLPNAKRFPQVILNAAAHCELAVLVLSEDFFSRSIWPMLELQAFIQAIWSGNNPRMKLLPLFFKISTGDLKDQQNQRRWLKKWQEWAATDSRIDPEICIQALKVLKSIKGLVFHKGLSEVDYRRIIVQTVCKIVPPYFTVKLTYVQGAERICQEMIKKINQLPCKETRLASATLILAVYGSTGMGKTIICKILCNYFRKQCRVCHIQVGGGDLDHLALQKLVLKQLTGATENLLEAITNSDEGQYLLMDRIKKQQVFLAIDNVCNTELSIHITRMFLRLGLTKDSLVLVTACTYEDLLEAIGYDISGNCFHLPNLIEEEAISILLERAIPNCKFASLTDSQQQIIRYCTSLCQISYNNQSNASNNKGQLINYHYHPSSLIKMGAQLGGNSNNWVHKLQSLSRL